MSDLMDLAAVIVEQGDLDVSGFAAEFEHLIQTAYLLRKLGISPAQSRLKNHVYRTAWAAGAERLDVERAQRIGLASQGQLGIAATQAHLDGGQALTDTLAAQVCRQVADRVRNGA